MKPIKILALLLGLICVSPTTLSAQNTSTQGKEFWLSFMHNGFRDHILGGWVINQVLISSQRDCSGTVTNPLTGWSQSFTVRANNITSVEIPEAQGYHNGNAYETIMQKGIKVEASDTISVYCTNIAYVSFDASFVLPIESLSDEYIIQCYDQSTESATSGSSTVEENQTSCFVIIATEDNTEIEITPTVNTLGGHQAGQTFSVSMNAGETYLVRSTRNGDQRDLSGTHVLASDCKPIAVFNGNTLTSIPTGMGNGYDHVFEQAMPLRSWGKSFVVTSSSNRNRDFIKITSSANNNAITMNGEALTTLEAGQSYTFPLMESVGSCFLQSEQPCAVYLFNNSSYDGSWAGGLGDPSMVLIAPVEQRINHVTFSTFDHSNIEIETHNVNIIVNTEDIANVYLDGQQISPLLFNHVNGNSNYSFVRKNISHGVHHITCNNGFNAHVYGFGEAKGYAYLVGSNAKNLSTSIALNDLTVIPGDVFPYCVDEPVTFSANVNFQEYSILWDFGDGTTSTENPTTHVYHDRQLFEASLYVGTEALGCFAGNSDTSYFYVDLTQHYITENDAICAGELYSGYGFSNVLINNDTILSRLQDNPDLPECPDSLLLYITAKPQYHVPITDNRCWQGNPAIYDDYGFSFEYSAPGTYEHTQTLQTTLGCDSIIYLTLHVANQVTYDFDHHECNGSYTWDGRTYDQAGVYSWTYTTAGGCDSIATLHLTMGHTQNIEFDTILCGTFIWDGTEYNTSGDFTRLYTTQDGCDSIVTCHLDVQGNVEGATTQIESCDSYDWEGATYTETGLYPKVYPTSLGCDSTVYLDLTINFSPNPSDIYPVDPENIYPHWVVTATEFQINSYEFHFWDNNDACRWDSVRWEFENPEIRWLLVPDSTTIPIGKKCNLFVLNYVEDTVWLIGTAFNKCNPQGAERRYWFLCSFYGIDGHETLSNQEAFDINVLPNPNKGAMRISLGKAEGHVDVSVYNMQGQAIDRFSISAAPQSTIDYNLGSRESGIYLFVFNYNGIIVTKKIIVTE